MRLEKRFGRGLSFALAITFCSGAILGTAAIGFAGVGQPVAAFARAGQGSCDTSPAAVGEVRASRTANSSTYLMSDGSYQTKIFADAVHYQDASGDWQDIDVSLVPTETLGVTHTKASDYDETFASEDVMASPVTVAHDDWSLSMRLLGGEESGPVALGDTADYPLAMTDTQLKYEAFGHALKDTLVLSSKDAPDTFTFFLSMKNLSLCSSPLGGYAFVDSEGKVAGRIASFKVFDSSVVAISAEDSPGSACTSATMSVVAAPGGAYVTYKVPRDWLNDPARVFPVSIDPVYGWQYIAQDTFVGNGTALNSNFNDSDHLSIGNTGSGNINRSLVQFNLSSIPKGATISSALFQLYCNMNNAGGNTTVCCYRATQYWGPSATWNSTFNASPPMDGAQGISKSIPAGLQYVIFDTTAMVQSWFSGAAANYGFLVKSDPNHEASSGWGKQFRSLDYHNTNSDFCPHLTVNYVVPSIPDANFDKGSYKPGDTVNATVNVSTKSHPTNVQMNVMSGSTWRGRFLYTTFDPQVSRYQEYNVPGTSDWFSFDTSPDPSYVSGAVTPDLTHCTVSYDGSTCSVHFAYQIGTTYGDVQNNHLWAADYDYASTPLADMGAAYSVLPAPSAPAAATTTASATWWSASAGNDDTNTAGRGSATLSWLAAPSASGYYVYLFDGNTYERVATTTATTWSSAGSVHFPSDSGIAALPAGYSGSCFATGTLDLRDDPRALYAKTAGSAWDNVSAYAFKVVPFNSAGVSAVSDMATIPVTLDCRTLHASDDPEHTAFDLGGIEGDGSQALLDRQTLTLSATDLDIDSYGPDASLGRTYDSDNTSSGYFGAPGWILGFEENISASATGAVFTDDSGDTHVFAGSGQSGWVSPVGLDATLTGGAGANYVLTYRDRTKDTFTPAGQFLSEADNNNLLSTATHGSDGSGHDTVTILAANGRSIVFTALGNNQAKATYTVGGQTREVDYAWNGTGSGASANGTETVSYVYSDSGATPTSTTSYVYASGRVVSVLVTSSAPIADANGSAEWDFSYTGNSLTNMTAPACDKAGDRPVTRIAYGTDASGVADATVTQTAEVSGTTQDVSQTFGVNPTGTMAYKTNPKAAGDPAKTWTFAYAPTGDQASVTDPDHDVTRSVYDSFGDEIASIDAMQRATNNVYSAQGDLISSTDPLGSVTNNVYDANGNLTSTTGLLNAAGERSWTRTTYDTGATWRETNELAELSVAGSTSHWLSTDYSYDPGNGTDDPSTTTQSGKSGDSSGNNLVAERIDLGAGVTTPSVGSSVGYDGWGNATRSTDASGNTTLHTFDLAGDETSSTDALGLTTNHTFDGFGHQTSTWQSRADTTTIAGYSQSDLDAFGRVVEERSYLTTTSLVSAIRDSTVDHFFDPTGKEIGSHDTAVPGSDDRSLHDAAGDCVQSWPAGLTSAKSTDPSFSERSAYDAQGRETSSTSPGASVADSKTYNPDDTVATESKPDGTTTTDLYDAGGNVVSESVASTAGVTTTRSTYDVGGRLTASFDGDGSETDYNYDLADRQVSAQGPGEPTASTTAYNALDWTISASDADGIVTTDAYDDCGRQLAETVGTGQGPTRTSFDAAGRLVNQTDPNGRQLTDVYDAFGRMTEESQVATTNPAIPLAQRTLKDTLTTYDAASRVATATDAKSGVTTTYGYADPGTAGATIQTVTYGGLSTTVQVSGAGNEVSRATTGPGVSFTRSVDATDQAGRITAWHLGGFSQSRAFGSGGHVVTQNGSAFSSQAIYVYAGLDAKKSEDHLALTSGAGGPIDWTYAYNADGRITTATPGGSASETFRYDDSGNVTAYTATTERTGATTSGVLHYTAGRLDARFASNGTTLLESYAYDPAQGYRTSQSRSGEANVTYTYTGQNGLATYSKPAGAQGVAASVNATYTYDATGQRLHSSVTTALAGAVSSVETTWTYTGTQLLSLSASQSAGGSAAWRVTYLYDDEGHPYAGVYSSNTASATAFGLVTTDRGDVVALTDTAGAPFASYRYDAWGRPLGAPVASGTGSVAATLAAEITPRQVLRYAGYVFDEESGLYYCSARTYDPSTMQFLQKDPAKADGEDSEYQYCTGDPVGGSDPSGMISPDTIDAYHGQAAINKQTKKCKKYLATHKSSRSHHSSGSSSHGSTSHSSGRTWKNVGVKTPNLKGMTAERVVVKWAYSRLGGEYVFGAAMPGKGKEWTNYPLDCSNLTAVAYRLAHNVSPSAWPLLVDYAQSQYDATKKKSLGFHNASGSLRIGDLGFLHRTNGTIHHVGLYVGNSWVIEAKGAAYGVVKTSLTVFNGRGADWHRARKD